MKEQNPFHAPVKSEGAVVQVEQGRAMQEVQAAMIVAKKFPRDQHAAFSRIMTACERPVLAEAASYSYPRGGTLITGPTIRLAEVMAQNWGNMEFGIKELSQDSGGSEVQAFAWDLETNVRQSKTFIVPHKMKAYGSFKVLKDPRDIYEHVANMGARRLRACILGIIPGDIVDAAVIKCEETLVKGEGKPIEDRVRDMLTRFKEIEISQELIEKRLQHKTTAIVRSQLVELGKIYNSIKDGMSERSDWFDVPASQVDASGLSEKIKQKKAEEKPPTKIDEPKPSKPEKPKTIEEPFFEGQEPEQQKAEESKDKEFDWTDWRKTWINLGAPGFSSTVHKNRSKWDNAPPELQAEGETKWTKFYRGVPWPVKNKPIDSEEDKIAMIKAMGEYFEQSDITQALHQHEKDTLTSCDMAMLRKIYKYLRENVEKPEDLE